MELLAGARLEQQSPMTPDNLELFNDYGGLNSYIFMQRRPLMRDLPPPQVSERPPEVASAPRRVQAHRFESQGDGRYLYSNGVEASTLQFRLQEGRLEWVGGYGHSIQALHYSRSENLNAFSMLGVYEDPQHGRVLIGVVFYKPEVEPSLSQILIDEAERIYNYLFGPNVVVRWPRNSDRTLQLCGVGAQMYRTQVQTAISDWQQALGERLRIRLAEPGEYPPFSDLNSSCLYSIDQFIMDPREDHFFLGLAVYSAYLPEGRLFDSDIFIFNQEFQKMAESHSEEQINEIRQRTFTHEIGHWLGLHHQFDGTESIMSYNPNHRSLSTYDRDAVKTLYSK